MRYKTVTKGDEDKVSSALAKLMEEDLTLKSVNDKENRQLLLYGIGDQQLEVVVSKLLNRYKVEIELCKPKFAFRETLRKKVSVQGKYKKQSGGHGQYGDVKMEFEPSVTLRSRMYSRRKSSAAPFRRTTSRQLRRVSQRAV